METKKLAEAIVNGLREALSHADLPAIRSVYISGSYSRGDWLDCSSDLDVGVIVKDMDGSQVERDIHWLQNTLEQLKGAAGLPSHCPGGIDLSISPENAVPKTREEAGVPSPYTLFSSAMFDLYAHHISLYGEELTHILPPYPDPARAAVAWLAQLDRRIGTLERDDPRAMFLAYKAATAAQLHFGEPTLHKYRILELYQAHVPDFAEKSFGERVIRNYLGSFYPERPPMTLPGTECAEFVRQLRELTREDEIGREAQAGLVRKIRGHS